MNHVGTAAIACPELAEGAVPKVLEAQNKNATQNCSGWRSYSFCFLLRALLDPHRVERPVHERKRHHEEPSSQYSRQSRPLIDGQLHSQLHRQQPEQRRELDDRIQRYRRRVLERIAHGIADDGCIVQWRTLLLHLNFDINLEAIARYGLSVMDVQEVIMAAVGGANVTQTIEGRQRYPVNVRYGRELRDDLNSLQRVLVATPSGAQVPLKELVDLKFVDGPGSIKSEAAQLVGYVYVDVIGGDAWGRL